MVGRHGDEIVPLHGEEREAQASVAINQSTRRLARRSCFSAIDAMPNVKDEVRRSSVSMKADPILNTCAGPGAPAVAPSMVP